MERTVWRQSCASVGPSGGGHRGEETGQHAAMRTEPSQRCTAHTAVCPLTRRTWGETAMLRGVQPGGSLALTEDLSSAW